MHNISLERARKLVKKAIRKKTYTCISVEDDTGLGLNEVYTVGMTNLGYSEIIFNGVIPTAILKSYVEMVADLLIDGRVSETTVLTELFEMSGGNHDIVLKPVDIRSRLTFDDVPILAEHYQQKYKLVQIVPTYRTALSGNLSIDLGVREYLYL